MASPRPVASSEPVHRFDAVLEIVGVNPFVFVPEAVLEALFERAGRRRGPLPICGEVNGRPYRQTLVRFAGAWRLYVNTAMLPRSPARLGERLAVSVAWDPRDRTLAPHPLLVDALAADDAARQVFEALSPSRRTEIVRYLTRLKSEESVQRNVARALRFLHGEARFVGRSGPFDP